MKDKIFAVELAFDNAPGNICKQASERTQESRRLHHKFKKNNQGYFILRTCRRIALFTTSSCPGKSIHFFEDLGIEKKYLKIFKGPDAVRQLLEIAAGLKSPNIGENEILHQLKNVLKESGYLKTLDVTLRKLLQKAIETGRRVRSETNIAKNNLSYPAIVHMILKENGITIDGQKILILGNGKLGNSCIKYFVNRKANITLATRNRPNVSGWEDFVKVIARDEINKVLWDFNIIIGAASSKKPLVSKDDIGPFKNNKPFFIDLAMPANFDMEIKSLLPDSFFNLDSIFTKTRIIKKEKSIALQEAKRIIEEETEIYMHWLKGRKAVKIISTLKEELEQIKSEEQNRLWDDFGEMDLHQKKIISNLVNRLTSRIAHMHYSHIKEFVVHEQS